MGALVLYDITKPATFENLDKWISELKEHADPCVCIMIVGNKTDLRSQRVVSTEEGRLLAGTDPSRHLISSPCIHYLHNYSLSPLFQIIPTLCTLLPNSNPFPHLWFFKSMTLKLTFELLLWWDLWSLGLLLWSAFLLYLLMIWTYCVLYFSEITMYVDNFFLGIWTLPYLLPIPVFFYTKFMQTSDKIMRVY